MRCVLYALAFTFCRLSGKIKINAKLHLPLGQFKNKQKKNTLTATQRKKKTQTQLKTLWSTCQSFCITTNIRSFFNHLAVGQLPAAHCCWYWIANLLVDGKWSIVKTLADKCRSRWKEYIFAQQQKQKKKHWD